MARISAQDRQQGGLEETGITPISKEISVCYTYPHQLTLCRCLKLDEMRSAGGEQTLRRTIPYDETLRAEAQAGRQFQQLHLLWLR